MTSDRLAHIRTLYATHPMVMELCSEIERLQYPEPILEDAPLSLTNGHSASPKHKKASRPQKEAPSGYTVPLCFANVDGFTAALTGWIESRRKMRKPPTGRAIQLLINRLEQRPKDAIAALDMTIERGWASIEWEWFDKEKPATNGHRQSTFRGVSL